MGIANLINEKLGDVNMAAVVTAGGIENVRLLDRGEAEIGFANYDAAYFGYMGQPPFNRKMRILGLFTLYPSSLQIAVPADSPIRSIADLRGKRVVVGPVASSSAIMGWNVLKTYGITEGDIRGLAASFADGANLFRDGNADALFVMSAHPNSVLMDLANVRRIRLLSIEPDMRDRITAQYPYYGKITIPANTYRGQAEPVETLSLSTMLIVGEQVSADLVYRFTTVLFDNLERVRSFHAIAQHISAEGAPDIPIPMHPGAARYFREKNLLR